MAYTTIDDPTAYFQNLIWSGNNSDNRALTFDGNSNLQADMTWFKGRTIATNHQLIDSVRGVTKQIKPDINNAEATDSTVFKSFNSNGITIGVGGVVNDSGETYCSWNWKESATAGFDIVTYTGNETARTISHSLSAVPHMMIIKNRGTTGNWAVYHIGLGSNNKRLELDGTAAADTGTSVWNDTDPTSSVFSVGNNDRITNGNTMTYVGYLFAPKQGFSKFGSYTGNGNNDGTFIYTGFKPAFILRKNSSSATSWSIMDNKRFGRNVVLPYLHPDATTVEQTDQNVNNIDILSNGFKCRESDDDGNASGSIYIYMAFAENPFVTSGGVPATAF
jgi:hypothetical protein